MITSKGIECDKCKNMRYGHVFSEGWIRKAIATCEFHYCPDCALKKKAKEQQRKYWWNDD